MFQRRNNHLVILLTRSPLAALKIKSRSAFLGKESKKLQKGMKKECTCELENVLVQLSMQFVMLNKYKNVFSNDIATSISL